MSGTKQKSKLLVVTTSYPLDKQSSSGTFVRTLNEHLSKYFDVCVVCPGSTKLLPGSGVHQARYAPLRFQTIAHRPGGIPVALRDNPALVLLLPVLLISLFFTCLKVWRQVDCVIAHWSISGFVVSILSALSPKPCVTVFHGSDVARLDRSRLRAYLVKVVLHLSDRVIVVSQSIYDDLIERFPEYTSTIEFIPNGVEESYLSIVRHPRTPDVTEERCSIMTAANLNPLKGVQDIIKAVASLSCPCKLTVLGDGPQLSELKLLAKQLDCQDSVFFKGYVPPSAMYDEYKETSIFILASYKEGRSSVLQEAMASGLPVIVSDIPNNLELVQDRVNGLVFQLGDESSLVEAIELLAKNIALREELAKNARAYILDNNLTWANTAAQYHRLIVKITGA